MPKMLLKKIVDTAHIVVENLSKDEAKRLANLLKKKKLKQRDVEVIGRLLYKLCKEIAEAKNLEKDAKRLEIEIYKMLRELQNKRIAG
jgi:hypothetical protein